MARLCAYGLCVWQIAHCTRLDSTGIFLVPFDFASYNSSRKGTFFVPFKKQKKNANVLQV